MAYSDREIRILVKSETDKATANIRSLNKEISNLKKKQGGFKDTTRNVEQMSRSFSQLTKHVGQLALIYGAFEGLNTTIRTVADFEESIVRLGVVSGASVKQLADLEHEAMRLGESTMFTASQVADGMNAMAMSGLDTEQTLAGVASVLDIASVSMMSIEDSALVATRAMNGFGLEAEDIYRVSDVMTKASTNSATTVEQLGNAFEKVSTVAKNLGVSIEETSASLGVLADAGRVGSEAGTQLKIVMSRLAGNKEAKKYIDELGISMYDATTGKAKPFITQLELIRDTLAKLEPEARDIKLSEIFGEEGKASAIALLGNLDGVVEKLSELENAQGFASASAKKMQDTLSGSYRELKSALEGLVIKVGKDLTPVLEKLIDDATLFIQRLDPAEVKNFSQALADQIKMMIDFGKMVGNLIGGIVDLSQGIRELTGISGREQLQMAGMIYGINKLFKAYKGLSKGIVNVGKRLGKMGGIFRKVGAVMVLANPIIAGLALAVGGLTAEYIYLSRQIQRYIDDMKTAEDTIYANMGLMVVTKDAMIEMGEAGRRAFGDVLASQIKNINQDINNLQRDLLIEEDRFWWNRDQNRINAITTQMKTLESQHKTLMVVQEQVNQVSAEELELRKQGLKTKYQAVQETRKLTTEELKSLTKTKEAYEKRETAVEKSLAKIRKLEQGLQKDKLKMLEEYNRNAQRLENERKGIVQDTAERIRQAQLSNANEYQRYISDQAQAEKYQAQAKQAILQKNFDLATELLNKEASLRDRNAGQEIEVNDKVVLSAQKAQQAYIQNVKESGELRLQIADAERAKLDEQKNAEEAMFNKQIANAKDREKSMMEQLKIIKDLAKEANEVKVGADFTEFEKSLSDAEAQLKVLEDKELELKVNTDSLKIAMDSVKAGVSEVELKALLEVDETPSKEAVKKFREEVKATPVLTEFKLTTEYATQQTKDLFDLAEQFPEVEFKFKLPEDELKAFKDEADDDLVAVYRIDTDGTEAEINKVKELAEDLEGAYIVDNKPAVDSVTSVQTLASKEVQGKMDVETAKSTSKVKKIQKLAEKPLKTTLTIVEKRISAPQQRKTGGLIYDEPIQKFNTGGFARKTGKLGGYGGGDKVKALLEAGEFIIKKETVKMLGLDTLHRINEGNIPKFQTGGYVGVEPLSSNTNPTTGKTVNLNLNLGGENYAMITDEQVAQSLEKYIRKNM